jgi:hypothetical protein
MKTVGWSYPHQFFLLFRTQVEGMLLIPNYTQQHISVAGLDF